MRNALLLSSGSKVALVRIAAHSTRERGIALHAVDRSENVPTAHFVDAFQAIEQDDWIASILQYCQANKIGLVIPTRHSDLLPLAKAASEFEKNGITIALSSLETIELCIDKFKTADFLKHHQISAPKTFRASDASSEELLPFFPLVAKPSKGSAGKGVRIIKDATELRDSPPPRDYLLQTQARGQEYTINVYVSKEGECLCAIPHKRLVVDGGESVQAITERNATLIELARAVVDALPGAWGPLNIQAFRDASANEAQIIEINPRLGGGFPLAHQAKGRYIEWFFKEVYDNQTVEPFEDWTDGLRMMRYRDAIFDQPL